VVLNATMAAYPMCGFLVDEELREAQWRGTLPVLLAELKGYNASCYAVTSASCQGASAGQPCSGNNPAKLVSSNTVPSSSLVCT
jgi:hypothetical protein